MDIRYVTNGKGAIMDKEVAILQVKIENTQPVDLLDLTGSLSAMASEYKRHLENMGIELQDKQVKLLVKEVRSGSIEIDLIDTINYAVLCSGVLFAGNVNTLVDFAKNMKQMFDWLSGKSKTMPETAKDKAALRNYSAIVEPIANDSGSQLTISPMISGTVYGDVNINILSLDANAVQNRSSKQIELLKEPVNGVVSQVLLRWNQTRNDTSNAGDRAIIESISKRPVKTIFDNNAVKMTMLQMDDNFFRKAFIVDVSVDTIEDVPKLYKIMKIHDNIDLESE